MDNSTKAGTLSGTILVLLLNINLSNLFTAAVLAAVGASVSFGVSVFWNYILRRFQRK